MKILILLRENRVYFSLHASHSYLQTKLFTTGILFSADHLEMSSNYAFQDHKIQLRK